MFSEDRGSRPSWLALCLLGASLVGGGCSFLFVDGPPAAHKNMPYFDCTSSNIAPVVDVIFAASTAIESAALLGAGSSGTVSSNLTTTAAVALAEAALFGVSAASGFGKTSSCREARADLMQRALRNPGAFGAPAYGAAGFGSPTFAPPGVSPQPYDPWSPPAPPGARPQAPPDAQPPGAPGAVPEPVAPARIPGAGALPPPVSDDETPTR